MLGNVSVNLENSSVKKELGHMQGLPSRIISNKLIHVASCSGDSRVVARGLYTGVLWQVTMLQHRTIRCDKN